MAAEDTDLAHLENPANDYRPSRMADRSSTDLQALQLDFYQAMSDFRHMFPDMDEEIIEAVLRANNGTVDATIDQLLTMGVDIEGGNVDGREEARARILKGKNKKSLPPEFQTDSTSSSDEDPWAPPPYPPPSYTDYTRTSGDTGDVESSADQGQTATQSSGSFAANPEQRQTDSVLVEIGAVGGPRDASLVTPHLHPKSDLPPAPVTPMPPKMKLIEHKYTPGQPQLGPKKLYGAKWNPPMLGQLPEDFLRLSVDSARDCSVHGSVSATQYDHRMGSNHSSPRGSSPQMSHVRTQRAPALQQRSSSELNSQVLQQRLVENQQKTGQLQGGGANAERAQYLADERLALCIQNEEFLWELQTDEEFMKTLQRDRMNATAFEPVPERSEPQPTTPELDPGRPKADQLEGYGDEDRDKSIGPFPFDQKVPDNETEEFRRQLNQMGGSSRKKFMALAKNFFTRKKKNKSPKQILQQTAAPSTANLLEEDYEEGDDDMLFDRPTTPDTMEGSPFIADDLSTVPTYKTVQRPPYNPDTVVSYHGNCDEMV